ncbi:MAG: hypothetical protein AB4041_19755 [Microcystaceae cyanobacterium]
MPKSQPLAPLNIGNVVTAAVTLYRSHLKDYLGIALRATLWQALPVLAFAVIAILGGVGSILSDNEGNDGIAVLLAITILGAFIVSIVLWFIGFSRYLVNSALISRLAFKELINQPERIVSAREAILPYKWSFLGISVRVGFAILGISIGLLIGFPLLLFVVGSMIRTIVGNGIITWIFMALVGIAAFIAGGYILIWFFSRWFIAEIPLAVENNISGVVSMQRSWKLTQEAVFRVQGIAIISLLITLPLVGVTNSVPQTFLIMLPQGSFLYWVAYVISLLLGLSGSLLVLPFWQTIKAVVYYDLRNRKEGLNITLRND